MWRRVGVAICVTATLAVSIAILHMIGSRREAAMESAALAASTVIREARAAGASAWAPDELQAAERASRDALVSQRIQETSLWPLPDADSVVVAWAGAERTGRDALVRARDRSAAAAASAAAQIDEAARAVSASETLASTIHLGARRDLVSQAGVALREAQVYQREGDLRTAASRARDARELAWAAQDQAANIAARYAEPGTIAQWQQWKAETIAWSRREGRPAVIVNKEAHSLTLFVRGEAVKIYRADLGFNWIADKLYEGDGATPEGRYRVVSRMANLGSMFYKALLIDYPNADDRARFGRARRDGVLGSSARIGGLIEIHGSGGRNRDWTNGCVAVANPDMDELFARISVGTPVTIVGSDDYGSIAEFAARQRRPSASHRP